MSGIDNITRRILADTERDVQAIRDKAEAERREIAAKYEKEAQEQYWKLVTAGRTAADQVAERMGSMAALEAKKHVLATKQTLVDETFALAVGRFLDLPEAEYIDLLATLAVRAAKTGREALLFSPKDHARCGKQVVARANALLAADGKEAALTLSEETREMSGGVIVTDGLIDINCSFEAMVEVQKADLLAPVSEILFD
ncbi:MAG: V-type ATP synthase subunit E family protein [Oscillospiraceae bacterium]|nr:V-type ATP synthase subunit E family protein [Oscillospiraceae bacterium]